MDNLSRDVFGNVSFTKQLKENKSFSEQIMKIHYDYTCKDFVKIRRYFSVINYCLINFKISLN